MKNKLLFLILGLLLVFSPVYAQLTIKQGGIGTSSLPTGYIPFGKLNSLRIGANAQFIWDNINARLGIGTSTPGSVLSIGNTGNNTINILSTATSTFGTGLNLRTGCFAINGVCISGTGSGGSGTVTSVDISSPNSSLSTGGGPVTTTGTLTGDLNLNHRNDWLSLQTFVSASSTSLSSLNGLFVGRTATTTIIGDLGTSTFSSFISATAASTTATSTLSGVNLPYGGCVAIKGVCITDTNSGGTVTSITASTPNATLTLGGTNPVTTSGTISFDLNLANPNIWTGLQTFKSASSTSFSSLNGLFVGGTATTSIVGNLGTSTFSSFISAVAASTTATSTMAGINLPFGGCFAVNDVCVGGTSGGGGSGTVSSGLGGQLGYYNVTGTTIVGTSTNPLYVTNINATSTTATSTLNGAVTTNSGVFTHYTNGITSIGSAQFGTLNFEQDAGLVQMTDLSVVSASNNTSQGYTSFLDGLPGMTILGFSTGNGNLRQPPLIGIGTTSPYAKLTVWGNATTTNSKMTAFNVVSNASSTLFTVLDNDAGGGNVGVATTTPTTRFSVGGASATSTFEGSVKAGDYYSADATRGFTGTCSIAGLTSISVKNGLIVSCN